MESQKKDRNSSPTQSDSKRMKGYVLPKPDRIKSPQGFIFFITQTWRISGGLTVIAAENGFGINLSG